MSRGHRSSPLVRKPGPPTPPPRAGPRTPPTDLQPARPGDNLPAPGVREPSPYARDWTGCFVRSQALHYTQQWPEFRACSHPRGHAPQGVHTHAPRSQRICIECPELRFPCSTALGIFPAPLRGLPSPLRGVSTQSLREPLPESHMTNFVGKAAPAFTASAVMPDGSTQDVSLSDYSGQYVALFFYPKDFTFV